MYQNSKLIQLFAMFAACAIFAMCKPVVAGFGVIEPQQDEFYGNAQNRTFKSAVEGIESLDESDRAFLASVEESRTFKRWYTRIMFGQPRVTMKNIENQTNGANPSTPVAAGLVFPTTTDVIYTSGVPMSEPEKVDDSFSVLLAWGYHWVKWAWELELMLSETLKYQAKPVKPGVPIQVQADVTKIGIFNNIEYTFDRWFDFMPVDLHLYALFGFGLAYKQTDVTTLTLVGQARQTHSTSLASLAWQLGAGARYQISPHFLLEVTYRYADLDKVKFGPVDAVKPFDGLAFRAKTLRSVGGFLGLTYKL